MDWSVDGCLNSFQTGKRNAGFRGSRLFVPAGLFATLLTQLFAAQWCFGQTRPVDVKRNSPERKAILDALRPEVEKELKQKIIFVVDSMKIHKGFAFTQVQAQRPGGHPIDYSKTRYAEDIKMGAFDEGIFALLRKDRKRWRVLRFSIGATDVPYVDWDREFKAPRQLLGLPPRDR